MTLEENQHSAATETRCVYMCLCVHAHNCDAIQAKYNIMFRMSLVCHRTAMALTLLQALTLIFCVRFSLTITKLFEKTLLFLQCGFSGQKS